MTFDMCSIKINSNVMDFDHNKRIQHKYDGAVSLKAHTYKLALAGTPAQPRFAPLKEKNIRHGGQVDPGRKVKVCWFDGFIRFVGFNFGHV